MVLDMFELRLGRCLCNFAGPVDEFVVGTAAGAWPLFNWAGHPEDKCAHYLLTQLIHKPAVKQQDWLRKSRLTCGLGAACRASQGLLMSLHSVLQQALGRCSTGLATQKTSALSFCLLMELH